MVNANNELTKYAALLLFQFRVVTDGKSNRKRICEERIVHLFCGTPEEAIKLAQERGKDEEFDYEDDKRHIFFEFIGVVELVDLISLDGEDEVWSRLVEKVYPLERKDKLIPKVEKLSVFRQMKGKMKL